MKGFQVYVCFGYQSFRQYAAFPYCETQLQDFRRYSGRVPWVITDSNAVAKGLEHSTYANGIFKDLPRGKLTETALNLIEQKYQPSVWACVGPFMWTEAIRHVYANGLEHFEIMKQWDVLPIHYEQSRLLHEPYGSQAEEVRVCRLGVSVCVSFR